VHSPDGDGGEAHRREKKKGQIAETAGRSTATEDEESRIRAENGHENGRDKNTRLQADGEGVLRVIVDERRVVCSVSMRARR